MIHAGMDPAGGGRESPLSLDGCSVRVSPAPVALAPQHSPHSSTVDRSRPDFVQLRSESVRLSTFHDWPSSAGRIVDPRDLATTGLFYTGHADRVQCAFCRGCLRSWKPGDRADEEHRRQFADCPLVRGAVTGNVPSNNANTSGKGSAFIYITARLFYSLSFTVTLKNLSDSDSARRQKKWPTSQFRFSSLAENWGVYAKLIYKYRILYLNQRIA